MTPAEIEVQRRTAAGIVGCTQCPTGHWFAWDGEVLWSHPYAHDQRPTREPDIERPPADPVIPATVPTTWRQRLQWVALFLAMVWFVWGSGLADPFLHT